MVFQLSLKYLHVKITNLLRVVLLTNNRWFVRDIWHKYNLWHFKIVSNFTRLTACEITYNNFEISRVVFMPNIAYKSCYYQYKYFTKKAWSLLDIWLTRQHFSWTWTKTAEVHSYIGTLYGICIVNAWFVVIFRNCRS